MYQNFNQRTLPFLLMACLLSFSAQVFAQQTIERVWLSFENAQSLPSHAPVIPIEETAFFDSATKVTQSLQFALQQYEMTCGTFLDIVLNDNALSAADVVQQALSHCEFSEPTEPVSYVTYDLAQDVCDKMGARLPDESEWMIAAVLSSEGQSCDVVQLNQDKQRGVNVISTSSQCQHANQSIEINDEMVGFKNSVYDTQVGNNGLYGLCGNVWEWTNSLWKPDLEFRVIKGGAYTNDDKPWMNNPRLRNYIPPFSFMENVGFRCLWDNE